MMKSIFVMLLAVPVISNPQDTPWDVNTAYGPASELDFTVTEATWMNLDVSPEGLEIVFDVLGDLYLMPIQGGMATRISFGAAYDMQPRFSPDGTSIAYVSDRNGTANLWVMDRDGRNSRQISKEEKWFINSPAWSPDGQYLFARHHFVKERSLGAGEIWMYNVAGSTGLQVTEKTTIQKDSGEPSISPDGRYLYYSKDITPSPIFEYNKDPNSAIYAIVRRDLITGEERLVVEAQGGATTPQISPDGQFIAFIRRVRLQSLLYVQNLATGEQWPIFDGLDKDLQEAWAIHGLYPQYSWSSDGAEIYIWGQGKIWRVDVEERAGKVVPFTAHVQQTIHDAVRFQQTVFTENFPVRMLRHVTASPNGKEVIYSALGRLYRHHFDSGDTERVSSENVIEFAPAFSPDGHLLAYSTWSDKEKGRVRILNLDDMKGRDLITAPGHYSETSFSRDGRKIIYRRTEGDLIRGETFGTDPGIYIVDVDSGKSEIVREEGFEPRFDNSGQRIFLNERRNKKLVLVSTDLNGDNEIVHFESDNATQIVPSPNGKWIVFAERFKIFVAPFAKSGRIVKLTPESAALPVVEISETAGYYLHWSEDSRQIYWSLGPEFYTLALEPTLKFDLAPSKRSIGFLASSDLPSTNMALVGARIITMKGEEVINRGTIVVNQNRIVEVGESDVVEISNGTHQIDVSGRTIIPGIVDVHAHLGSPSQGIIPEQNWRLVANLAYGVTTTHDPSNNTETVFTNSEMIRAGEKLGPRLYSTGTVLYGAETPFKAVIRNYDDALAHLKRLKAVGAFTVKSYNQQRRDVRQMIVKAARELEMMVLPEGGSLLYMDNTFVLDGHTGLEHSLPVPKLYEDVVTLFAKSGTGYTPTLIVGFGGLSGEFYWYQHDEVWRNEQLLQFTPREVVDRRARRRLMAPENDFNHVLLARGAKQIVDAGGSVQLGAHGQVQGLGAHWELWMFHQGGMTELEALRSATLSGAQYLGLDKELGSIEKGKLADLVVLNDNPLEDIRNTDSVLNVMLNGRLYDSATMNEYGNDVKPRPLFYWQKEH